MAEVWQEDEFARRGPPRSYACEYGLAWSAPPASAQHPAAGARWRLLQDGPRAGVAEFDVELRCLSGARALYAVQGGAMQVREHSHDWPTLTLHLLGAYSEEHHEGEVLIDGPAAVLYPAGEAHRNLIAEVGLEVVSIHFDPAWLRREGYALRFERSRRWTGGQAGAAARDLAVAWRNPQLTEAQLGAATARFMAFAYAQEPCPARPAWLEQVREALDEEALPGTMALARRLDLHPAWLARAYRAATGEGLRDSLRRRRVERAAGLLRRTNVDAAQVAAAVGFCDQSHMSRAFRQLAGRTPVQVRNERRLLNGAPEP